MWEWGEGLGWGKDTARGKEVKGKREGKWDGGRRKGMGEEGRGWGKGKREGDRVRGKDT